MPADKRIIAFDYGDVLVRDTAREIEQRFGYKRLSAAAKKEYARAWHLTETGRMPNRYILEVIKKIFRLEFSVEQIHRIMFSARVIRPVWQLCQKLRKKYKVVILTNNFKHGPGIQARFNHISLGGIKVYNSAEIGYRKPELIFFKYFLKDAGQAGKSVIFIDDHKANIAAAKSLGIRAIRFTGNVQLLKQQLKKLKISLK